MNTFGHGIVLRWRPAAVTQSVGRVFFNPFAIVLLALLAVGPARAERAVLYDEDLSNPSGQQHVGSVVWRTDITKVPGQSDEVAISANVDIPARRFKMTLTLRRNLDKSLPASHVVDVTFDLPPDFVGGGIGNVPGVLLKSNELARGVPLAGLAVKVTDGFFMVGLSNVDADRARNLNLLLGRGWFDVPLVYSDNRRAIIAIEKGTSGAQAFKTAFTAWGQYSLVVRTEPVTSDSNAGVGDYVVQVSSQRSEADAQASYKVLQDKFPNVLGAWVPIITRADTGANGIFYRAAVGPFKTADEASQFCGTLKAAGGQCVVQRN
jgi:SPOR domain